MNESIGAAISGSVERVPQTFRQYYTECEKNIRDQLVKVQSAWETAAALNLLDRTTDEVRYVLYFDSPF